MKGLTPLLKHSPNNGSPLRRGLWYNLPEKAHGGQALEVLEKAHKAVEAATDKLATDILILDMRKLCGFADYFVLCSGDSARQISAIYEEVGHRLKKEGVLPHHHEGTVDSGWMLIDFGDVVVHVFAPEEREYYRLDELWSEAVPILRIQ
jgi:ribosome-associated protein